MTGEEEAIAHQELKVGFMNLFRRDQILKLTEPLANTKGGKEI